MPGATPILGLPYPIPGDTVDVPRDVKALADAIDPLTQIPVGGVILWPTAVAPARYLLCNGQQVAAATYPALAAVLGQAGGLITLPNFTDRFPAGPGAANGAVLGLGPAGFANNGLDAKSVQLTIPQLPNHNHGGVTGAMSANAVHHHRMQFTNGTGGGGPTASAVAGQPVSIFQDTEDTNIAHTHIVGAQGNDAAHENRPPLICMNFVIRAL